jgi:hypothetical protein
MLNPSEPNTAVHPVPAWKNRGDTVVLARINEDLSDTRFVWEELWCRRISESEFELCCIPFFRYDESLGDIVECSTNEDGLLILSGIGERSGHLSYRVWVTDTAKADEVESYLRNVGCLIGQVDYGESRAL